MIETDDAVEMPRVEEDAICDELLAAHAVARAGDANAFVRRRSSDRLARVGYGAHDDDGAHARRIEA
jgi:hypothetical protein